MIGYVPSVAGDTVAAMPPWLGFDFSPVVWVAYQGFVNAPDTLPLTGKSSVAFSI
jgi:hypothetical protein